MFDFKLTLDEANLVLAALGKAPFEQVAGLIGNILKQAEPQLPRVQQEMEAAAAKAAAEKADAEGKEAA